MSKKGGALERTRILDLSDEKSIYGAKILADLGAVTIRPELDRGDPLRKRGPFDETSGESLWYTYFASSRKCLLIESTTPDHVSQLNQLAARADVVIVSPDNDFANKLDIDQVRGGNPGLVIVSCSSFGSWGPWKDYQAPDLVASALGGTNWRDRRCRYPAIATRL